MRMNANSSFWPMRTSRAPSAPAAPQQKKRLPHPTYEVDVENDNGNEQLERTPTPAQGRAPMKGRDAYSGRGLFDELKTQLPQPVLVIEGAADKRSEKRGKSTRKNGSVSSRHNRKKSGVKRRQRRLCAWPSNVVNKARGA